MIDELTDRAIRHKAVDCLGVLGLTTGPERDGRDVASFVCIQGPNRFVGLSVKHAMEDHTADLADVTVGTIVTTGFTNGWLESYEPHPSLDLAVLYFSERGTEVLESHAIPVDLIGDNPRATPQDDIMVLGAVASLTEVSERVEAGGTIVDLMIVSQDSVASVENLSFNDSNEYVMPWVDGVSAELRHTEIAPPEWIEAQQVHLGKRRPLSNPKGMSGGGWYRLTYEPGGISKDGLFLIRNHLRLIGVQRARYGDTVIGVPATMWLDWLLEHC